MSEPFRLAEEGNSAPLTYLANWSTYDDRLTAGFTTRHAGNTALHIEDDPQAVVGHRMRTAERLGWSFAAWTCAEQVHGSSVRRVTAAEAGSGRDSMATAIPGTDALMTDEPDVLLVMFFADCVPLYFYDTATGAMALAHAGWKGTAANIAGKTVEGMREAYGTKPGDLIAAIGPSIGGCCYEVDEAVLRPIRDALGAGEASDDTPIVPTTLGRARLDLKECNRQLMIKAGILPTRIEMSKWCTSCSTDLFFSHRKEKGNTGRMMSWLGRKSR